MGEASAKLTVEDYLALTDGSTDLNERLEWVNGEMYAMAGGSSLHSAVGANLLVALGVGLRGKPCRANTGDQRVAIKATGNYVYPDAVVVCGPFKHAEDGLSITNPRLIAEVLSPSTANFDRSGKFENYTRIDSLTDYVLIEPETRVVTHYRRQSNGWLRRDYHDGIIPMMDGELSIEVEELFVDLENVTAEPNALTP